MSTADTAASLKGALVLVPTMAAAAISVLQKLVVAGGLKQQAESVEYTPVIAQVVILGHICVAAEEEHVAGAEAADTMAVEEVCPFALVRFFSFIFSLTF